LPWTHAADSIICNDKHGRVARMCIPVKLATYSGAELATLDNVDALIQDYVKILFKIHQEARNDIISSPEPVAKSTPE